MGPDTVDVSMSTAVPAAFAGVNVTDEAKRIKDEMDLHAVAGSFGWAVFRLSDGAPVDHVAYERWQDAVRHMRWDRDNYMYVEIQPGGMPYNEAQAVLNYARGIRKMGHRIPAPDWADHQAMSMPYQPWDRRTMARQLVSGRPLDSRGFSNLPSERLIQHG